MTFSEQFREARKETGLSVAKLAERMLISKRTLEAWDSGLRTPPLYVQRFILNELNELSQTKPEADEEGIYLIYKDSADDYCENVGYIKGTEEEAEKYCVEYNKKQGGPWREVGYGKIHELSNKDE